MIVDHDLMKKSFGPMIADHDLKIHSKADFKSKSQNI
jgi:hypothetical protein